MATLQPEFVEVAGLLRLRCVPLPLDNVAGGNVVRLQDQRLGPVGVISSAAERIVNREIATADRYEVGLGRGRDEKEKTRGE
jgi:hypothetical protein